MLIKCSAALKSIAFLSKRYAYVRFAIETGPKNPVRYIWKQVVCELRHSQTLKVTDFIGEILKVRGPESPYSLIFETSICRCCEAKPTMITKSFCKAGGLIDVVAEFILHPQ